MTQCQVCQGRSTLYLCPQCTQTLKGNLTKLAQGPEVNGRSTPGLLANLADVEIKHTRMGGGSGHRKRGDEMPAPFEPDTEKGRATKQGEASRLLADARNILSTTIRDLCESRGVEVPQLAKTAHMAVWLAASVHAIACDESADRVWVDVDGLVRRVERVLDRPTPIEMLGFCATELDPGKPCGTALRAPRDAIEVRCRKCRTTRRCDTVRAMSQSDAKRKLITWEQVLDTNKLQPDDWRVKERTLRHWRLTGALKIREYLRPDGSHGFNRRSDDDRPLYKWDDVERLRSQVPKGNRKRTRAGR